MYSNQGGLGILKKYIGSISDVFWAQELEFEQIEVTWPTVAEIWGEKKRGNNCHL
jgi:hypothetical protein